jgi:hypothetical protein
MTKTSNKASSSVTKKGSVLKLLMMTMFAGTLFATPSLSMAQQQQQTTTGTAPTTAPLTPEEQREQDRLKRTTTAITKLTARAKTG